VERTGTEQHITLITHPPEAKGIIETQLIFELIKKHNKWKKEEL
jgi:hypothetical protein